MAVVGWFHFFSSSFSEKTISVIKKCVCILHEKRGIFLCQFFSYAAYKKMHVIYNYNKVCNLRFFFARDLRFPLATDTAAWIARTAYFLAIAHGQLGGGGIWKKLVV